MLGQLAAVSGPSFLNPWDVKRACCMSRPSHIRTLAMGVLEVVRIPSVVEGAYAIKEMVVFRGSVTNEAYVGMFRKSCPALYIASSFGN
jgi:hypothetical protein